MKDEQNPQRNINSSVNENKQQDPVNKNPENSNIQNSKKEEEPNPLYTNSDAPQQEIERDTQGVMSKGTKDDPSAIYSSDNSTLQSKEEKQHDEKVDPQKDDHIETDDISHTEADDRFLRRGENLNKE
jgi:hypothetical protein